MIPEIKYIARSQAGRLELFIDEPERWLDNNGQGFWIDMHDVPIGFHCIDIPKDLFPEVTWEGGPRKITLKLED